MQNTSNDIFAGEIINSLYILQDWIIILFYFIQIFY